MRLSNPFARFAAYQRLNQWLGRSIVNRTSFAAAIFVISSLCFLGVASIPIIYSQVADNIAVDREYHVSRLSELFEYRFDMLSESAQSLARNSFVVNAFVDSAGRETYLQPLLRDYQTPFNLKGKLVVLDLNLNPIASNRYGSLSAYAGLPIARQVLQSGKTEIGVTADAHSLLFAAPVFFPPSSSNVGVVLLEVPLEPLFEPPRGFMRAGRCYALTVGGRDLHRSACPPGGLDDAAERELPKLAVAGEPARLLFQDRDKTIFSSIGRILLTYAVLALVSWLLATLVARRRIHRLTQPLIELSGIAQLIAKDPKSVALAPTVGNDEIGTLARTFNEMLEEMRGLQSGLEARVAAKTRELSASEARFRAIFEASPVSSALNDKSGNITFLNSAFINTFGYTQADIPNLEVWWAKAYPDPTYRKWVVETWQRHLDQEGKSGMFEPLEVNIHCKDGRVRTVLVAAEPLGAAVDNSLLVTLFDITARRQLEEERQNLSLAVEQSPASIVISDPDANITYVNESFCRNTGYSRAEIIGSNPRLLKSGHTSDEEYREMWATLVSGKAWRGIFQNRRKDGSLYWESAQISPVLDNTGRITHFLAVKEDITERRHAEKLLEEARAAAENANLAKSRFLATMSHEIRTPMNGILGMAQLLLQPRLEDAEREDYARTILTSGQTLLALLNDILDLSKVDAGKLKLEPVVFAPTQAMHDIQTLFADAANQKGLRLESGWSGPRGQRYRGDPHRLRQMLSNLVGNAIKFTAQGSIRIEGAEVERSGNLALLEFSVTDTGIGIPEDKQKFLFKPFSQADSSITRQYGGTGLGLSIVRSLAQMMDGDVGVESEAGEGARFWFRIRAGLVAAGEDSRHAGRPFEEEGSLATEHCGFSGRVLVVEDNQINRKVIEAALTRFGLSVALTEDGQQGVDAITRGEAPDMVLMDIQMPVLDGYAATARIRQWEAENARPRLPIIALTADAYEEDRQRCLAAGMDDFLTKPVDINALPKVLSKWLKQARIAGSGPKPANRPAARTTPDGEAPVFDEQILLGQLGGDRMLARTIVDSAINDMQDYLDRLEEAVTAEKWSDARRVAHTLKGLSGQLGGVKLAQCLKEVDDRLKRGERADRSEAVDLRQQYAKLRAALLVWIQ